MTLRLENRQSRRQRVLKGGKIFYGNYCFSSDCVIKNQSDGGMLITVEPDVLVPQDFSILVRKDGTIAKARMVWHKGTRIGIELLSELEEVQDSSREHIRWMSTMITH